MKLFALSDLHVGHTANRAALETLEPRPNDWIAVVGDVGETEEHLVYTWRVLNNRFKKVLWTPGNHELWSLPSDASGLRGVAKYERLVEVCREHGVLTPEDPWVTWPDDPTLHLAPMLLLYDYTFAPDDVGPEGAVAWAREERLRCRDEDLLHADPYPSIVEWCHARVDAAEKALSALPEGHRALVMSHFPLRRDLTRLPRIPRFNVWCGTRRTEDWHTRFPIDTVLSGHLHMRATDWRDGVRFEEVSLGSPKHYSHSLGAEGYLRTILPAPNMPPSGQGGPLWHR